MAIAGNHSLQLTEEPKIVTWPEMHYVYVEAVGPFMTSAPEAWGQLHKLTDAIAEHNKITGYTSAWGWTAAKFMALCRRIGCGSARRSSRGRGVHALQRREIQPVHFDWAICRSAGCISPSV